LTGITVALVLAGRKPGEKRRREGAEYGGANLREWRTRDGSASRVRRENVLLCRMQRNRELKGEACAKLPQHPVNSIVLYVGKYHTSTVKWDYIPQINPKWD
jgi:hypothetical protein